MRAQILIICIVYLLLAFLSSSAPVPVTWNTHPYIISGRANLVTGPAYAHRKMVVPTYSVPYSLPGAPSPINVAVGYASFEQPALHDFHMELGKTLGASTLFLDVWVLHESLVLLLDVCYIIMGTTTQFRIINANQFIFSVLNGGQGYRSQYDVIPAIGGFSPSNGSKLVVVIESLTLQNGEGLNFYLGAETSVTATNDFNTTFTTMDLNVIDGVNYSLLYYDEPMAQAALLDLFHVGTLRIYEHALSFGFIDYSDDTSQFATMYSTTNKVFMSFVEFNFTLNSNVIFHSSSNFGGVTNISNLFTLSPSINKMTMSLYLVAVRGCPSPLVNYYYQNQTDISQSYCDTVCPSDKPYKNTINMACSVCHYSCLTCNDPFSNNCTTACRPADHRTLATQSCPCNPGYVDVGLSICASCSEYLSGCNTCSSTTNCLTCNTGFTRLVGALGGYCNCSTSTSTLVTGFCTNIFGCVFITTLNGSAICSACNSSLNLEITATFDCMCVPGSVLINFVCTPTCGDGYRALSEQCDDNNIISGDGCSSLCIIEATYVCVDDSALFSTCKINTTLSLSILGTIRDTSLNRVYIYVSVSPNVAKLSSQNLTDLLNTSIPFAYKLAEYNESQGAIKITLDFTESLQFSSQQITFNLNDSAYFWYGCTTGQFTPTGLNCEISYEQGLWQHNSLDYVCWFILILMYLIVFASFFFERWIGLELLQVYQSVFFIMALGDQFSFQFSAMMEVFKYTNGFNSIQASDFYRSYQFRNELLAMNFQNEFALNFNIMFVVIILSIVSLVVIGMVRRYYTVKLQELVTRQLKDQLSKVQKAYDYTFSNVLIMAVFISLFQIYYSFTVQTSWEQSKVKILPDSVNIMFGFIGFVILFSTMTFILYWYIQLPKDHQEDNYFLACRFRQMQFSYPIIYLLYQILFITIISIFYSVPHADQILIGLECCYLLFLIIYRPYKCERKIKAIIHNGSLIINQIFLIASTAIMYVWNLEVRAQTSLDYDKSLSLMFFTLIFLLIITLLTALRLFIFDRELKCKCLNKEGELQNQDLISETMKKEDPYLLNKDQNANKIHIELKSEKNNALGKKIVSDKKIPINQNYNFDNLKVKKKVSKAGDQSPLNLRKNQSPLNKTDIKEQEQIVEYNENFKRFLTKDHVAWNEGVIEKKPVRSNRRISQANMNKTANLKKSAVEEYIEMQNKIRKESMISEDPLEYLEN